MFELVHLCRDVQIICKRKLSKKKRAFSTQLWVDFCCLRREAFGRLLLHKFFTPKIPYNSDKNRLNSLIHTTNFRSGIYAYRMFSVKTWWINVCSSSPVQVDKGSVAWYELLSSKVIITTEVYYQQIRRFETSIQEERSGTYHRVILCHDNAHPHIAKRLLRCSVGRLFHIRFIRFLSNKFGGTSFKDNIALHLVNSWLPNHYFSSDVE